MDQRYCYLLSHKKASWSMFMLTILSCVSISLRVGRDNDEWHDVAVPGLDNPDPEPLAWKMQMTMNQI